MIDQQALRTCSISVSENLKKPMEIHRFIQQQEQYFYNDHHLVMPSLEISDVEKVITTIIIT